MCGFDKRGLRYDKDGEIQPIMLVGDMAKYNKRAECFKRQYNRYSFYKNKVDGARTLQSNMKDGSGLQVSFRAYRKFLKTHGPEKTLPGLEQYSNEQLFFLAFANQPDPPLPSSELSQMGWRPCHEYNFGEKLRCQTVGAQYAEGLLRKSYSPGRVRIIGALSNSEEFADVWYCPKGCPMNPTDKCVVW